MKWMLWIAAGLAALILIVTIVGWMLPVKHEARHEGYVARPIERVYALIADVDGYGSWLKGVDPVKVRVEEAVPPSRIVTRIDDPSQPFGGTWTFTLVSEGAGTRVTIVEHGEVYNPIFRFMSRFVFGHTATMEAFVRSL